MSPSTKSLVTKAGRYLGPAALSAAIAVGAVALVNHNGVHASAVTASPLDDHSVAALTAMDDAMEAVAARVTPAVVNIAGTSTPSMDEVQQQGGGDGGQMQGLPPGLQQFFGPGGPFGGGGHMRPQQPQLEHGIGSRAASGSRFACVAVRSARPDGARRLLSPG